MKKMFLTITLVIILGFGLLNLFSLPVLADSASCESGQCDCFCSSADTCNCCSGDGECSCECGNEVLDSCEEGSDNYPFHTNFKAI